MIATKEGQIGGPDGWKEPVGPWKSAQQQRCTRLEAEAIQGSYGIVTGRVSGIVVLDCDGKAAMDRIVDLPVHSPMWTRTGKRDGFHFYFKHPGVEIRNGAKLAGLPLDVRGDGGYVIGPGSLHWSGRRYEAGGDWTDLSKLPVFDPSWLAKERQFKSASKIEPGFADPVTRAAAYVAKVPGAIAGQGGHNVTFRVACLLVQRFGLPAEQAYPLMLVWNASCQPPWKPIEIRRKLEEAIRVTGSKRGDIQRTLGE